MNDVQHMRDAVFFEGPDVRQWSSRFWILIVLSSIIAAGGIAADSAATVHQSASKKPCTRKFGE